MFDKKKFKETVAAAGKTPIDIANMLGIDESTYYRKLANDGSFSRSEIELIVMFLNMERPLEIFFGLQLAETQDNI